MGTIDFVLDLANPVPGLATLQFLGLPLEDWEAYAGPMHAIVYTPPGSPEFAKASEDAFGIVLRLVEAVEERKREPRDDLITYLVNSEVDGEKLPDERVVEMCHLVIAGGVDTTTSLIACALDYLDQNRAARQRLIDDPALIPSACEEFLRYYSPTQALARTATRDVEIGGQLIRAGDRVLISWASADHDPTAFEHPDEIVLDRFPNRHAAFGLGAHRCLGSNFARAEFTIMLEQVLARMPDYTLDRAGTEHYESIGVVNGFVKMPATFTPGAKVGTASVPGLD
jgi:cytochrome P450